MDNLIPAAIYARFSSHAQREESIEQQLHVCREWARSHGYRIIREYSDSAISGTTDKRPEFQRMIYESERAGFEVLLVYSYDRFARNRYDSAIYKTRLKKNGIRVVAVTMPLDDKPESILFESIMEGYAEYYSANLARNVSRGMMDNALKAKVNGPVPLGYRVEDGKYAIDPEGAKIVRDIFDLYDHNVSASEIARILNRNGYQTRGGRAFSYQSVYKILINERYTGFYIYKDVRLPGGVPEIIEPELWERIQLKMKIKGKSHRKGDEEFLLTGKLFCGECGSSMVGESGRSSCNGRVYRYYKCLSKKKKGAHICKKKPERKADLEEAVISYITVDILTDENIKTIAARTFALLDEEFQDKSLLAQYEAELKDTMMKIKNIMNAVEAGNFHNTLMDRLSDLELKQQELEGKIVAENLKKPEFTQEHIEYWLRSFKDGSIDNIDYVKGVINSFVNSIFVYDAKKDEDRRIVIALNLTDSPVKTLKSSDICYMVDQKELYPNFTLLRTIAIYVFCR